MRTRSPSATPPWSLLLDLAPQLVSFDAVRDGDAATDDPAFRRLVEAGAAVAWGLVPATGAADDDQKALAGRLVDLVRWTAGDYLPEVLARSLVTPTCGLAGLLAGLGGRRVDAVLQPNAAANPTRCCVVLQEATD